MPPRDQVRIACQRCRKRRAKCDGEDPCQRCQESNQECVYGDTRRESKDDLRAEIERLKKTNKESEALLNALSSLDDIDTYNTVARGLIDNQVSRQDILQELADKTRGNPSREVIPRSPSQVGSASLNPEVSICPHCQEALLLSMVRRPRFSDGNVFVEAPETISTPVLPTPVSLTPVPSSGDASPLRTDIWTRTGWTVAYIRQLFDSLLTWDYLPFCLLCKDPFLRDYHSGLSRYCSSALVNALLALATRRVNENQDDIEIDALSGWSGGKAFFDEAKAILYSSERSSSLPDIQALGILALYQISCGREADARELSSAFAAAITDLCLREPLTGKHEEQYARVRATTYCGAISVIRILRLTTGRPACLYGIVAQDDTVFLDQPFCSRESTAGERSHGNTPNVASDAHSSQLSSLQTIPARIFQLTEWVYKLLASTELSAAQIDTSEVVDVYTKCLDWYENFFSLLNTYRSDTPFILFIHMYYQFCLLCLFRPFVNVMIKDPDIRPREICLQASQSILALTQSYGDLFTLQRVSVFIPYFVSASGLLSLAMEDASEGMQSAHAHVGETASPKIKADPDDDDMAIQGTVSSSQSQAEVTGVAHARLLLTEMGRAHPGAEMAEKMLRRGFD
ncbi:hypothetical protein BKA56DRAFT_623991 [Ilyonectria sp. MPI-CAGE-AT-0026]|nr:hypothetical protein BKA56DRAFT_623991 [Ilyonectria sp. MPI-CAGE-AT-0026]